jgi:Asp-tRNA(Asn)/Glu-tRNA(Gln) amidotransferase C subunit
MRKKSVRPIRLATGLVAAATLAMSACGSDDDGGGGDGDTAAFCEEIQTLAESTDETTEEQDLAALRSVADAAPGEIADEMNQLVEAFEQLQAFDPEAASEEEMADFLTLADGLDEASTAVEEFALANCPDLPADLFETE